MIRRSLTTALALALVLCASRARGGEDDDAAPPPRVLPHEVLAVAPSPPPSAARQRHIRALIDRLRGIDSFRPGLTRRSGGGISFSPDGSSSSSVLRADGAAAPPGAGISPAHAAWTELVARGPEALPFLLERLDDPAPTVLRHVQGSGFGGTWSSIEVDVNAALRNEVEAVISAWGAPPLEDDAFDEPGSGIVEHAVTVGDCCFAILGEITNRAYEAMRYQPTACTVINSPTRDPRIALAVRRQWAGKDPRVELARRLMADLNTTHGESGAGGFQEALGWRQAGAARRLAFWFADVAERTLLGEVARMRARPRGAAGEPETSMLAVLSRSPLASVRAAVLQLALETDEVALLAGALDGLDPPGSTALLARIRRLANDASRATRESNPDVGSLLAFVERTWPEAFESVLRDHLALGTREAVWDVVDVLYESDVRLPVGFWRPLLDHAHRAVPWERSPEPAPIEAWRVCDFAALRIARLRGDVDFDPDAALEERDARIAALRTLLDGEAK